MAWMIKSELLDKEQNDFITDEVKRNGHIWVKGFAGSGKSVLLVHALKDMIEKNPKAKVLVVVYTLSLVDLFKTGMKELGMPSTIPVITYYDFVANYNDRYDCIFCDEVQDLPAKVLLAMENRSNKVIVAGDSNQSIFEMEPKWQEPVIQPESVGDYIKNVRPYNLNTIYRLTKSIIAALSKLIPGMDIWKAKKDETKQDVQIRIYEAQSISQEVNFIWEESQKGPNLRNQTSVILLPTHNEIIEFAQTLLRTLNKPEWKFKPRSFDVNKPREKQKPDYYDLNSYLKQNGLKIQYVGNDFGSLENSSKEKNVIVMTYDSSKGLDFDNVFLPFVNGSLGGKRKISKTLFMVAMSRSKVNLFITYMGYSHDYIDLFKNGTNEFGIAITDSKSISDLGQNIARPTTSNNQFDY
ncbi:MAG: AAA family ATPase [Saprospiraceae bacterium]|jgi:superfamily I DNA/RNA helicase|nr:AAA family ATPase [Saprospiraceae bacterium]